MRASQDVIQKNLYCVLSDAIHMFKVVEQQQNIFHER